MEDLAGVAAAALAGEKERGEGPGSLMQADGRCRRLLTTARKGEPTEEDLLCWW